MNPVSLITLVLGLGLFALVVASWLARNVLAKDRGSPEMQKIADAIQQGARAFLRRQNRTITVLAVVLAALIFVLYRFARSPLPGEPTAATLALTTTVSFLLGAFCSGLSGFVGMHIAVRSNLRTAHAATTSLAEALRIALRGGAVSGFFVVALSVLGVGGLFALFRGLDIVTDVRHIPLLLIGFGFGASFVALFAQLGGGIYTKAADVGADLVGKVEVGIPEDDPRNPAVIADLVGDNVGDCAGRGADLFESTAAENIGAMILGSTLVVNNANWFSEVSAAGVILFPLVVAALGLVASIVGVLVVRGTEDKNPMDSLNKGFWVTAALIAGGFIYACKALLNPSGAPDAWWHFASCGLVGIATSIAFLYITQYYTEHKFRPIRTIAKASVTGAATNIISGMAMAFENTAAPAFVIGAAILGSYQLGETSGLEHAGLFGIAAATMGMLGTAGFVLAMDTFGPITDNAGGIVEMSGQPKDVRARTDRLDAAGNTTKALTKGYAIGSAALAAFLLFSAYLDEIRALGVDLKSVDISKPAVFVAGLLGAMMVFWFSSLAISAVAKAAQTVIVEVRRQYQANPGILKGTSPPDYAACVDIVTVGALRQMVFPGIIAVALPVGVGLVFKQMNIGAEAVAGFLMIGTIAGILVAILLNNGGGAWDNAKKLIELGNHGGKGSDAHKAAVVGDTVGDPFKDTAGPSLHVLIKLMSTVTLVLAPLFV